jgi:hypothetical protein
MPVALAEQLILKRIFDYLYTTGTIRKHQISCAATAHGTYLASFCLLHATAFGLTSVDGIRAHVGSSSW